MLLEAIVATALCVPCQTCKDVLANGVKVDMVYGEYDYEWDFACGTVVGQLSADRKKISLQVPDCCKVRVCRKAGTDCDTTAWLGCGQDGTYGVSNGKELSHVSIEAMACCVPPTPTATPTPEPTRTPTPTPTATPHTPTPTPCIPSNECGSRCGNVNDGCGGSLFCGTCPPPPPPPGKTPVASCDTCVFPDVLSIRNRKLENEWIGEWFYFMEAVSVRQIILEMDEHAAYAIYIGTQEPFTDGNKVIFEANGPGIVTIPVPLAGLGIQQFKHLGFYGGTGRMTIWLDSKNSVIIKQDDLKAIVK